MKYWCSLKLWMEEAGRALSQRRVKGVLNWNDSNSRTEHEAAAWNVTEEATSYYYFYPSFLCFIDSIFTPSTQAILFSSSMRRSQSQIPHHSSLGL